LIKVPFALKFLVSSMINRRNTKTAKWASYAKFQWPISKCF